jgi:hypothetical protein
MTALDPAIQAYYEKARHDHATLLYAAIQEGETRGEARGKAQVARNLKSLGLPMETIEKTTGLGTEAIRQL